MAEPHEPYECKKSLWIHKEDNGRIYSCYPADLSMCDKCGQSWSGEMLEDDLKKGKIIKLKEVVE